MNERGADKQQRVLPQLPLPDEVQAPKGKCRS